jgi:hypothetical protein
LRHHAGCERVAQEDIGIAGQRDHTLLDPGAAGIVEPDDRRPCLHREVHDLADLPRVRLGQRAAEHGEVLGEDEDRPAVDAPRAGDDAVAGRALAGHVEVRALVDDELVDLGEGSGVEQDVQTLARGLLAGLVLPPNSLLTAGQLGFCVAAMELVETILMRHQGPSFIDFRSIIHQ